MSAISVKYLNWFAILLGIAVSACHNEDLSPTSTPAAAPITPAMYSVSVTVSGLNGTGLVLQNNGGGDVTVTSNGGVTFASTQLSGSPYAVTVATQPGSPDQTCTVANGSGMIAQASVTNVSVTCTDNYVPTYAPAPKGDPQGTVTTQLIDAAGGSLTSADGRVTLDIPAGALAAATTVSIQPITNTTPNGLTLNYRLEPEGTIFAVPASLTFHLSATEALAIASTYVTTQHADGLWYSQPNQQRDSNAQTVGVSTSHFSDWGIAQTLLLKPAEQRVKTNYGARFTAVILVVKQENDELSGPGEELALPEPATLDKQINGTKVWSVNGIEGGNPQIGEVKDPGDFTAPNKAPTPNKVTVTATVELGRQKVIGPAVADIYDQEIWTGTTDITLLDGTQIHADVTFEQKPDPSGSETELHFVVQSGLVRVKVPATSGSGCAQSISPDNHLIAAADANGEGGDGTMMLTYDVNSTGLDDAKVQGGGTTAWPVTLTEECPDAPQTVDTTEAAEWWPFNPGQTLTATSGVLDGTVSDALASGTIHFVRQ
jgi:hypothetical protein